MADKDKSKEKSSNSLYVIIMIALCLLGLAVGYIVGSGVAGSSSEPVLADGTRLGERLDALEEALKTSGGGGDLEAVKQAVAEAGKESNAFVAGEIKKVVEGKVADLADPPLVLFDLSGASKYYSKGPQDALVTLVEFSDFQCPYCSRMAKVLDEIQARNPDKVRIIFVDRPLVSQYRDGYPFHPYAFIAHEAAAEAGAQGKFWEMYSHIFENQQTLFPGRPKSQEEYQKLQNEVRDKLIEASGEMGLNKDKMKTALYEGKHKDRINNALAIAEQMGIYSTPTVYVNSFYKMSDPNAVLKMLESATPIK